MRRTFETSVIQTWHGILSCDQIVERVKKFNFGPKDGVPKTTILYPIDFLPAR